MKAKVVVVGGTIVVAGYGLLRLLVWIADNQFQHGYDLGYKKCQQVSRATAEIKEQEHADIVERFKARIAELEKVCSRDGDN